MKKQIRKMNFLICALFVILLSFAGCQNMGTKKNAPNNTTKAPTELSPKNPTSPEAETVPKTGVKDSGLIERANKIAKAVTSVQGINKANVVISEKRALVGVNMDKKIEGSATDKLKQDVEKVVKETDKEIETVAVSADADVFERLGKIGEGIKNGRPLSEFGAEIEETFRRIIPKTK